MNNRPLKTIKQLFGMFWQVGFIVGTSLTGLAYVSLAWAASVQGLPGFTTRPFEGATRWLFFLVPLGLLLLATICLVQAVIVYVKQKNT